MNTMTKKEQSMITKADRLWARYQKKPSQNLLAEIYDHLDVMAWSTDAKVKSARGVLRARAEKEAKKAATKIRARGMRAPRKQHNPSRTTLDFGPSRIDVALDALDELDDVPNHDIQHDFGRITFQAEPDDSRMFKIYDHMRLRGVAWIGPGRIWSNKGSLRERLKNAY